MALATPVFGKDQEVAAAVTGLDVIVAGHTNTYLSNEDEEARRPLSHRGQRSGRQPGFAWCPPLPGANTWAGWMQLLMKMA